MGRWLMNKTSISSNGIVADYFRKNLNKPSRVIIMLGESEGDRFWSRPKQLLGALTDRGCALRPACVTSW